MSFFIKKNLKFFTTKYLQTQHPEKTNVLVKRLLNKEYNKFINESEYKNNYENTLSDLKSIQSSFSHDKESKLNRQIIFNSNQALQLIAYHHRSLEDHKNYSLKISELEMYKVYEAMISSFKEKLIKDDETNLIYKNNNFNPIIKRILFSFIPFSLGIALKCSLSVIFGVYTVPFILSLTFGFYKLLNQNPTEINQIKSIKYLSNDNIFEIELFSLFKEKIYLKRNMIDITSSEHFYKITDGIRNFYLPKHNSEGNYRLINNIMNPKLIDKNVDLILLSNKNNIDFSCNITSKPYLAIDTFIRKEIIKNQIEFEKLSHEEIYLKSLELSDNNVKEFLIRKDDNLKECETFEKYFEEIIGFNKSKDISNLLIKKFYYSNVNQLKYLNDEELKEITIHLNLSLEDIEKIKKKILN